MSEPAAFSYVLRLLPKGDAATPELTRLQAPPRPPLAVAKPLASQAAPAGKNGKEFKGADE